MAKTKYKQSYSCEFLADLGLDSLKDMLIMTYNPVFLLDLPLEGDPQILYRGGYLHFLLIVVVVSIPFLQLHFLGFD